MRRIGRTAIAAMILVFAFVVGGWAESPTFLYAKVITSEAGTPVKNQPVVIEGYKASWFANWIAAPKSPAKEIRVHSVTDEEGTFQVINLPPGQYTLKAIRLGGEPVPIREFRWDGRTQEITGKVSRDKLLPVAGATTTNQIEK